MAIKLTHWTSNIPNDHNIFQYLELQDLPKITQNEIFDLKIYHLATLVQAYPATDVCHWFQILKL
jgi:hypothetical protein